MGLAFPGGPRERVGVNDSAALEHPLRRLYEAMGHRAWSRHGVLWIAVGRFSLMAIPSVRPVEVEAGEMGDLLVETGRSAAVFLAARSTGVEGAAYVVRDKGYGLGSLQRQFRQSLRRGQEDCEVRPLGWEEWRARGPAVNVAALRRRGEGGSAYGDEAGWEKICGAAAAVAGLEVLGCFCRGELAAYLLSWTEGGICEGLVAHWSDRFGESRPCHVLYYEFARQMMAREGICEVNVGRQSLPARAGLDRFKRQAGYGREAFPLGVYLHPRLAWLAENSWVLGGLEALHRRVGPRLGFLENVEVLRAAEVVRRGLRREEDLGG